MYLLFPSFFLVVVNRESLCSAVLLKVVTVVSCCTYIRIHRGHLGSIILFRAKREYFEGRGVLKNNKRRNTMYIYFSALLFDAGSNYCTVFRVTFPCMFET